jgi:hypothetical protein
VTASGHDRSRRRTRDELHQLVLHVGIELLLEEGLGTGAEHLTFKRVFERLAATSGVRVTNASVIGRIWVSQDEFQIDVLSSIAGNEGSQSFEQSLVALALVLEAADRSTVESRWQTLREMCRVGGAANLDALVTSRTWPSWVGVWALVMAGTDNERKRPLVDALVDGYEMITNNNGESYATMSHFLGLRVRSPLTLRQFTIAADALAEGCALRDPVDQTSTRCIVRPTGPNGEDQEWTLFGVGLEALADEFFEPDPEWELV